MPSWMMLFPLLAKVAIVVVCGAIAWTLAVVLVFVLCVVVLGPIIRYDLPLWPPIHF